MSGVFPGLPWLPAFESSFPVYRPGAEGMEDELLVDPGAEDISRARIYSFQFGVFASADDTNWTDITAYTTGIGPIWYGTIADNVYGWSFQVSGIEYNSALLVPGNYIRLSKATTTLAETTYVESWMRGRILPSPVQFSYLSATWSVQVVDDITYLSRKKAPVFSVGTQNLAIGASVEADSSVEATVVLNEGEFYGFPELSPEKAIDSDLNSLWISGKAPDPSLTRPLFPLPDDVADISVILNEFYYKGYSPTSNQDQWFEVVTASNTDIRSFQVLTRSGGVLFRDIPFGQPTNLPGPSGTPNSKKALFAVLAYDAGRFEQTWGTPVDVPVSEYKNSREWWLGCVEPDAFGFNADGQGDFFAIATAGDIINGAWRVYAVVDGPKMRRFDRGYFTIVDEANFTVRITKAWSANELVGCFVKDTRDIDPNHHFNFNRCRRIKTNTATVPDGGSFVTTLTFDGDWDENGYDETSPLVNDQLIIRPWPEYTRYGGDHNYWHPERDAFSWHVNNTSTNYADFHLLADTGIGTTWRKSKDGWHKNFIGLDDDDKQIWEWVSWQTWITDSTPSPGPSSGYGDYTAGNPSDDWSADKYFPWIKISLPRFSVTTSSNLDDGHTVINVNSSDGLLQSYPDLVIPEPIKSILVAGTSTPVEYTSKGATTITLQDPWNQGFIPIGTEIYQYEDGAYTNVWPIQFVTIKRRRIPAYNGTDLRVIKKALVFVSYQDDPSNPDSDYWRESWDSAANPTNPDGVPVFSVSSNSTQDVLTFQFLSGGVFGFTRNYSRPKHVLISIREMYDLSRGRINEVEIIPPSDTVQGLQNSTVADFFEYALLQMGIPTENIQTGSASPALLGSFSTDTSMYLELLSDLATRTGQIVWAGPNLQARVQNHPNWPSSPVMVSWLTVDNESASALAVMPYTGYPISQLQVTVRDANGNTAVGVYPSIPLSIGEIVTEPTIRSADISQANSIARMIFNEISLAKLKVTISGPAPWARPGAYRVDVNYTLPSGEVVTGPYYISGIDHVFNLGGVGVPRTWITELELTRIVGAN